MIVISRIIHKEISSKPRHGQLFTTLQWKHQMALTIRQFNYKEITPRNIGHLSLSFSTDC